MYSKKLGNLTQHTSDNAVLVVLSAVFFLSACGIKGDLYQTPAVEVVEKSPQEKPSLESNKTSEPATRLSEENPSTPIQE